MNLLFLDQSVFEILGLQNLDEEKKAQLLVKMNEAVGERITIRVMDELPEEDKKSFDKLISEGAEKEKIDGFLSNKTDLQKIILEETAEFKEKLAQDMGKLKEVLTEKK